MFSYAWGTWVPSDTLAIPLKEDTAGQIRGYRIFTACRTVSGKIFQKQAHIDRLFYAAKEIYMPLPHSSQALSELLDEAVSRNVSNSQELLIEIIYTGGPTEANGTSPVGPAQLLIWVLPLKLLPKETYDKGVHLATFIHQRPYPTVKLMFYLGAVIAHQTVVKDQGADFPLFVSPNTQDILEGSTYNIFFVKNGVLYTPPLDGRILKGITREVVLSAAEVLEIPVVLSPIHVSALADFESSFISSSTRSVLPVRQIDNHHFVHGELMQTIRNYLYSTHGI